MGQAFFTIVRPVEALEALIATDPYARFRLPADAKRIVTFVRGTAKTKLALPVEMDGARILAIRGGEAFSAYVRNPKGQPAFMVLIERTFGKDVTTRTWDTVRKVARASAVAR
jgi:uncharacterized protein (DUF1697 family)